MWNLNSCIQSAFSVMSSSLSASCRAGFLVVSSEHGDPEMSWGFQNEFPLKPTILRIYVNWGRGSKSIHISDIVYNPGHVVIDDDVIQTNEWIFQLTSLRQQLLGRRLRKTSAKYHDFLDEHKQISHLIIQFLCNFKKDASQTAILFSGMNYCPIHNQITTGPSLQCDHSWHTRRRLATLDGGFQEPE